MSVGIVVNLINFNKNVDILIMSIFLDAEKTFDRMELVVLLFFVVVVGEFEIWTIFWIKLLYMEQAVVVQLAGCRSGKVIIKWGVRQGCPLSPLLFTIVIEILSLAVKQFSRIHGVSIGQEEHKVILYADDATFFCNIHLLNP